MANLLPLTLPLGQSAVELGALTKVFKVALISGLDLLISMGTGVMTECIFPDYDPKMNLLLSLAEAFGQVFVAVLIGNEVRTFFSPLYANDPTGGIVILFFLLFQESIMKKFGAFTKHLKLLFTATDVVVVNPVSESIDDSPDMKVF